MKNKFLLILIVFILIIGFIFYFKDFFTGNMMQKSQQNNKIKIITSFYPLYFFANEIGGERVTVRNITPPGVEPHDFDPTARELAEIEQSDLLILNGGIEIWGEKVKKLLQGNVVVLVAGEDLFSGPDPHIWLNPRLAKLEIERIQTTLSKIDPEYSTYYLPNAKALLAKMDLLDKNFTEGLDDCQTRNFITSHSAFSYLAKQYNLNQVSISGFSPDDEPSAKQLAEISLFAKQNNIKYIFYEKLASPKLAETVANEIGAETLVLDPLEGLSNNDINQGKNYFDLMQQNLINLEAALQCSKN